MTKFEAEYATTPHTIESNHVLIDEETGRVVAVFYNEYDLADAVDTMSPDLTD